MVASVTDGFEVVEDPVVSEDTVVGVTPAGDEVDEAVEAGGDVMPEVVTTGIANGKSF